MRRLLLLASCLVPLEARAQTAIPETIITGTRVPTAAERVPAGITVIDRQTIEERGYVTLAEALAAIPGLRLVQTGGFGQQASAFLRGAQSRHVQVLLDGAPINDPSDPNGAFNFGNELLGDIERIEVFRGPASSLYGSGAIGGAINLVSRRAPRDVPFEGFGEAAGGSNRTVRGVLGGAGTVGAFDYLGVAQSLSTQGSDATAPRFYSNTGERDGFRGAAFTMRLGAQAGASRVEGFLRYRENRFGLDDVPADDPNYSGDDRRWFGQVRGETRLTEAWTTGLRFAVSEDRRRYVNLPDAASRSSTDDLFRGRRYSFDWGNQVRLPDAGAVRDAVLAFGYTHIEESAEQASGSPFFRTTTDATARTDAGSVGLQLRLFERVDLSAALRHDAAEDYDGDTTWRLGAVIALPEVASRLRLSAGTGFLAPSLFQRFGRIGSFFQGNPDLKPERSFSWEAGAETDLPGFGRRDFATVGVTYFDSRIRDLINFNAAFDSLENVDRARIKGVELGLVLRPARWLEASLAWTITDARDRETDDRLARRPEHQIAVNARIAPLPRLVIQPELLFTGRSPEGPFASYQDDGTTNPTQRYNPSGTVFNLTVSYTATERTTLFVEGKNLGNSRFEPANGFVIPGRTAVAGLRAVF
jgi:vitamin B12 transporter